MRWLLVFSCILGVAWLPVMGHFYKRWSKRRNPMSLAICSLVALSTYLSWTSHTIIETSDLVMTLWIYRVLDFIVCLNFYVAIWYSKRNFPDGHVQAVVDDAGNVSSANKREPTGG